MDKEDLLRYLDGSDEELFNRADSVRKAHSGYAVQIRGIIELSNYCCQNCLYCGLRRDNRALTRYRMTEADIVEYASAIIARGLKTIVLQSGNNFNYTRETICRIIRNIKYNNDLAITLSIGGRLFGDYQAFREAGADAIFLSSKPRMRIFTPSCIPDSPWQGGSAISAVCGIWGTRSGQGILWDFQTRTGSISPTI